MISSRTSYICEYLRDMKHCRDFDSRLSSQCPCICIDKQMVLSELLPA